VAHRHGRIVKQIGDAFMLVFDRPMDAVQFGVDVCAAVAAESRFPAVHVGAHHGSVLYRDGDYLGTMVNLAARVASASAAGQFLVTADLVEALGDLPDVVATPPVDLKGIDQPQRLFAARHAQASDEANVAVCGMRLHDGDEHATATIDGERFVFCSDDCHQRFLDSPPTYLAGAAR
jgi:adenylate cyclase